MKNFFSWIKEHIRPIISYNKDNNNDINMKWKDRLTDIKKKSRIGIKIGFRF